ncbi:MAG TPA: YdeI/OmpD-associated family protein [Saprospiraceae bacterium]|nr:YdeI/OmpD-associated family protein [Saprospiraceae bacterium]
MVTTVDAFFASGCGRCPKFDTPDCKVHRWQRELALLRAIILDCGLQETLKWGHPVYTFDNANVLLLGAFSDNCTLSFFKGALLHDEAGILRLPGENTQSARVLRFTGPSEIEALEPLLKTYIFEAIEVEKAGLKARFKPIAEHTVPEEFQQKLDEHPALRAAFKALTPGRQRGYLMHFSQPKQASTRAARIEKCLPAIFAGKGLNE